MNRLNFIGLKVRLKVGSDFYKLLSIINNNLCLNQEQLRNMARNIDFESRQYLTVKIDGIDYTDQIGKYKGVMDKIKKKI